MQIGFARALLFMGLSDPNTYYQQKAMIIANLFKGSVSFNDRCEDQSYSAQVFMTTTGNAYWWYHSGWSYLKRGCWDGIIYRTDEPKYSGFTEFHEDMSHGAVVMFLPLEYFDFQPSTPFDINDMTKFRNTFAKRIYDDSGDFYNAVDGVDYPIYSSNSCSPNNCPHGFHKMKSLAYMPYERFDNTSTPPDIYNIIMDFYYDYISNSTSLPSDYTGLTGKGHSEVVKAQWEKECVNLTLYNRDVVYDQDFTVKNSLIIDPMSGPGNSFAEPETTLQEFIVEPNITVNFIAGESIEFKPGTYIKLGGVVNAYIDPNGCTDGQ